MARPTQDSHSPRRREEEEEERPPRLETEVKSSTLRPRHPVAGACKPPEHLQQVVSLFE
jgi:hypothetical protein